MVDTVYFQMLSDALQLAGRHRPTLVLDLDRLDANLELVRAAVAPGVALRVVDKSLPSIPLLAHVMERLGTRRIMSFDVAVACAVLRAFPDVDILFGKPMPTAALDAIFSAMRPEALPTLPRARYFWQMEHQGWSNWRPLLKEGASGFA